MYLPQELELRAIGWLDGYEEHAAGPTPDPCIARLFDAYTRELIIFDNTRGAHSCTLCTSAQMTEGHGMHSLVSWNGQELSLYGYGHHLVLNGDGDVVYMCPALILHYIIDHQYRPPDEFTQAVEQGRFLTLEDLVVPPPTR